MTTEVTRARRSLQAERRAGVRGEANEEIIPRGRWDWKAEAALLLVFISAELFVFCCEVAL